MNKFSGGEDDHDYQSVVRIIEEYLRHIRDGVDVWLRDKHYTDSLKIDRLSGKPLPMEQCYINLAIVEQSDMNADRSEEGSEKEARRLGPPRFHSPRGSKSRDQTRSSRLNCRLCSTRGMGPMAKRNHQEES